MSPPLDELLRLWELTHAPAAAGLCEVRLHPEGPGPCLDRRFLSPPDDRAALTELLRRNAGMPSKLVWGINPRARLRSNDSAIDRVTAVVIDADGGKGKLTRHEQDTRIVSLVELVPLTAVVASGTAGNEHLYWSTDPAEPETGRAIGKRLRLWLAADPTEPPCRVMRMPGSFSWKTGKPVQSRILRLHPGHRHPIEAFTAALDKLGAPALPITAPTPRSPRSAPAPLVAPSKLTLNQLEDLAAQLPPTLRRVALYGDPHGYRSRSERDMAIVRHLVSAGVPGDKIVAFFADLPVGDKAHENGQRYLATTIATARTTRYQSACSTVLVEAVGGGREAGRRAWLRLRVIAGPHEGKVIPEQGLTLVEPIWSRLWKSAGMSPPPLKDEKLTLSPLKGRLLRVALAIDDRFGLQVTAYLPAEGANGTP